MHAEQVRRIARDTDALVARTDAAEAQLDQALAVARLPWRSRPAQSR